MKSDVRVFIEITVGICLAIIVGYILFKLNG